MSARDLDVLVVALNHFAERHDTMTGDGYIAIEPGTRPIESTYTAEDILQFLPEQRGVIPPQAVSAFIQRNRRSYPTDALAGRVPRTKIQSLEDAGKGFTGGAWGNRDLATVVTLNTPGCTADGVYCFVEFSFTWSIHGAGATYLLQNTEGKWKVVTSHLSFGI